MSLIDAPKLAEFLDDNKNKKLNKVALRTDLDLLKKAGVPVSYESLKFGRKIRTLEYFLIRSHLYRPEGNHLVPYLISSNWSDYAKVWRTKINGAEIHVPFLGKIAFLCKNNGNQRIECHPESYGYIEKICVDIGALTFQKDPDKVNLMYKPKTCKIILETYKHKKLNETFLQNIGNTPFGRALLSVGLAKREGQSFKLLGDGLLLTEIKKIKEGEELEKVGRLILRQEQRKQAQISSVIVCLEYLERHTHPSEKPVGSAPRYWESKRTGKRYERLGHYDIIEGLCSIDSRAATNVLNKNDGGFAAFGAFIETYNKVGVMAGRDWVETYAFLSWYTDSLAFLSQQSEKLRKLNWPHFKLLKTERHKDFLSRFIDESSLKVSSQKDLAALQSKLKESEIIDMNIDLKRFPGLNNSLMSEYCSSNIFVTSKVPVNRELFENTIMKILQSPSRFKDTQGAFYYPDFRFLVSSTLGLSLRGVDQILAYIISTGSDIGRRLWFFPAFGRVPPRDRPDPQLLNVILKPFDSITLNY